MIGDAPGAGPVPNALNSLRRYVRPRAVRDRCELCNVGLPDEHAHLVDAATGRMACACDACALLFDGRADGKFRRVPRRVRYLADLRLTDAAWESLQLPINLAFFLRNSRAGRVVALYPSPGGATAASVPPDAWATLVEDNPALGDLEPDVEALLVNGTGGARECYRVGVDACYKLVGTIRTHWRGLSGGTEVWKEIGRFFDGLKARSEPGETAPHA
jgi:hypothetical protein